MKISFFIIIFVFLLICSSSFAQLDRANKLYDDKEYTQAIKLYETILQKNENAEALQKIANCYRLIKNYQQAELNYAKLVISANADPVNHLYFGMMLKVNNKIEEAKKEFKLYAAAIPSDERAELYLKSCDNIKILEKKAKQFDVSIVPDINSEESEFCPVILKNQLVFISDKNSNLLSDKQNFLHVYSIEMKKGQAATAGFSKEAKPLPFPINSDYHDGPVCFNSEQNLICITHVELENKKDKKFVNRSKLYFSNLKGNKWTKLSPFQYNSDACSMAHPSISDDGTKLFFASDMPGGQGGMDIYVCEKNGENWGPPKNLGTKVNTAGEEVFPYIRKDGVLYFSSDGHSGFGGLDVFSATKGMETYSNVKNLGADLNSAYDDFGLVFIDDKTGYFSSDRPSGKGLDDIYSFTALNKLIAVSGKIVIGNNINNPLKNSDVMLLSEDGKTLNSVATDASGYFIFEDLEADKKYMVKLDDTEPKFSKKIKYYLADDKDALIRETGADGKGGKFVFRNLPADPNSLPETTLEGVTFAGNLLFGKNSTKPLSNTKVNLLNNKGEIVQTVITNAFGAFVFSHLPADQNFFVKVDENDTELALNTKIIMTNKSGKEMKSTDSGNNGSFKFSFLAGDKNSLKQMSVEDTELRIDYKGKIVSGDKVPLANSVVNLVNAKGEIIQTTRTDELGAFRFSNLPADQVVLITLDETDTQLKKFKKVFITDSNDAVVKEVAGNDAGVFKFSILPSDKQKLGTVYVDDPWLKVLAFKSSKTKQDVNIIENIYYEYSKYEVLPEAAKKLDKVIDIMEKDSLLVIEISSHTDSRGTAETNMKRSLQRANAAVDYIVKNGISKNRISGKGYGETKLINKCADGVDCTEEEHAKNRRTEFKVSRKGK